MLGSPVPAAATQQTTTTPASPTRPSRLRGLSYLRSYTQNHLHIPGAGSSSSNSNTRANNDGNGTKQSPQLARSASSPIHPTLDPARDAPPPPSTAVQPTNNPTAGRRRATEAAATSHQTVPSHFGQEEEQRVTAGENGWVPTVQGRSGLRRESLNPTTTSTENINATSPEPRAGSTASAGMTRSRTLGPTPAGENANGNMVGDTLTIQNLEDPGAATTTSSNQDGSMGRAGGSSTQSQPLPTIKFIPHIEPRSTRPSLNFTALTRTLMFPKATVKVGRYSERDSHSRQTSATPDDDPVPVIGFKSKVVSRRHCEFWCTNGQWYVKDVKSSSGTFLNHVRLSPPGQESRPYPVNDGDVVQLGIDFKGGEEMIFRCVKIRVECNRGWQKRRNEFNTTTHKKLLRQQQKPTSGAGAAGKTARDSDAVSVNTSECSICLNAVAPCQALFVAPCSHVWHYKCIRSLIHSANYPNFLCPNCRFVADLEADVEQPEEDDEFMDLGEDDEQLQEVLKQSESDGREVSSGSVDFEGVAETTSKSPQDSNAAEHHGASASSAQASRASSRRRAPGIGRWEEGDSNIPDDELAFLVAATNLDSPSPSSSTNPKPSILASQPATATSSAGATAAVQEEHRPMPSSIPIRPTPGPSSSTSPFASPTVRSVNQQPDIGPMTPRNDAGPFVFDGSGNSSSTSSTPSGAIGSRTVDGIVHETLMEEDSDETNGDTNGLHRRHSGHGSGFRQSEGTNTGDEDDDDDDVFNDVHEVIEENSRSSQYARTNRQSGEGPDLSS